MARKIDRGVLVVVTTVALALPAYARANPLLSGYGGPGQGSQALLGSTLVGPRGGNGGSGGNGAAPAQSIEQTASGSTAPRSAVAQASATPGHTPASTRRKRSSRTGAGSGVKGDGAPASGAALTPKVALARKSSVHTDAAGLSGGDLALVVIAIGVIFATGALTARIARGAKSEGGGG